MSGPGFLFSPINGSAFGHLGAAVSTAYDPRAPLDEASEAGREVAQTYMETPAPDLVRALGDWIQLQKAEQVAGRALNKALRDTSGQGAGAKARTEPLLAGLGAGGRYVPKPGIPFTALRHLESRVEIAQAIHRTRRRQVQRFCQLSQKDDVVGWRLRHLDPNHELNEDETAYLRFVSEWLGNGGTESEPRKRRRAGHMTFRQFLALLVHDSLTFDHSVVETEPFQNLKYGLNAFWMRDSATFYLATQQGAKDDDDLFLYQEARAGDFVEFKYGEASLFQRNLTTDLERQGYGYSELESSLETLANLIAAMAYTREGLDNNAIPRGILVMSGAFDPNQRAAFVSAWQSKLRGVQNAHGLPVLFSKGQQSAVQYVPTGQPFSEMAFAKWISLQMAVMGSIYGIDPAEVGMEAFAADKSTLSGGDTRERLTAARDQGLEPFLSDIEGFISDEIVGRWAPWVRFSFTGLDDEDTAKRKDQQRRIMTIDELRQSLGMEPYPIQWVGALPSDPGLLSAEFQRQQTVLTLNEARRVFGGLPEYPDQIVGNSPINPSLSAAYNMALQGQGGGDEADGMGGDGADAWGEEPEADEAPAAPEGWAGGMAGHLADMHQAGLPEEA